MVPVWTVGQSAPPGGGLGPEGLIWLGQNDDCLLEGEAGEAFPGLPDRTWLGLTMPPWEGVPRAPPCLET